MGILEILKFNATISIVKKSSNFLELFLFFIEAGFFTNTEFYQFVIKSHFCF